MITLILFLWISTCISTSELENKNKVLVILDDLEIIESHSIFFKLLSDIGFTITFKKADDANLALFRYGQLLYEHVVIFAPTVKDFGGEVSVEEIAQFIDEGGNVLIAGSASSRDTLKDLAAEVGLDIDGEGASVIDHLHHDEQDLGQHNLIAVNGKQMINADVIVGSREIPPLLYQGTGLIFDPDNSLILPLIVGYSSSYSTLPDQLITEYPNAIGENTLLIGALQARNNARVVFSGSLFFFSDLAFSSSVEAEGKKYDFCGNKQVSEAVIRWVFKINGVLRVKPAKHNRVGEDFPPAEYTIKEEIEYRISVEILQDNNTWIPYKSNDIQLECVRIDPFVRITLQFDEVDKNYVARFKIPDVYGVYQLKLDYNRLGWSRIFHTTQISVRPFRHTDYERFIYCAYPYYFSAFSMMFGVSLFSFVFLHHDDISLKNKRE